MIRGYKIRIYPTKEQQELLWKHIGCCRYVWNYMLDLQQRLYEQGEKHLSAFGMSGRLTDLKKDGEHTWLYEVSSKSLQVVCSDLGEAYKRFFEKTSGFPKFKSKKKAKQNYPLRCDSFYFYSDRLVFIEKVGRVKFKSDFEFPTGKSNKFSNPRVSFDNNKWYVSFAMQRESQARELTDQPMGIDLGIKQTAIVAFDGKQFVFHNINKSKKMRDLEKRLKHHQRSVSRKYEASKARTGRYEKTSNIVKEEVKVKRIYRRIANIRHNYIHQTTHWLVSQLPCTVVMEDLNVAGMMKNRHLSKAIGEQNFVEFIRQMQYKCEDYGIQFVQADRFYPSSKTCSGCGCVKKDLRLSDRTFVCPECGLVIDRDYNAAINLSRYVVHT